MTLLYLDTSALIRIYTQEPDHQKVVTEKGQASGVVCHDITYVEAIAALSGRRTVKLLSAREYQTAIHAFQNDWPTFRHIGIDDQLLQDAAALAQAHPLRAYDAMHLAAALAVAPLGIQFMTFDVTLRAIAEQVLPGQVWTP